MTAQDKVTPPVMTGTVFNIQRYSIDDGPGIRTTVFLKGCPLKCPWCSNPESQSPLPQLMHRYTSCIKCGACAASCPESAVSMTTGMPIFDRSVCTLCGLCVAACENEALKITGNIMSVDDVWKIIRKDKDYYESSGGGVTCSGGEILTQADFVAEIFKKCRENGINTCADTSGFGTELSMRTILKYTDFVYFDIKHANRERHLALTGVPLDTVLGNLRVCAEYNVKITIRVPLIPEYNNDPETLRGIANLAREYAPGAEFSLLPYHKYGASKYAGIGREYALENLRENTAEEIAGAEQILCKS